MKKIKILECSKTVEAILDPESTGTYLQQLAKEPLFPYLREYRRTGVNLLRPVALQRKSVGISSHFSFLVPRSPYSRF